MIKNLYERRDKKQKEFADMWWTKNNPRHPYRGIFLLAPRFGKCAVAINVIANNTYSGMGGMDIMICYPELSIKDSWMKEMGRMEFESETKVGFCTHISLEKTLALHKANSLLFIIVDEIHLLSDRQVGALKRMTNARILGLTGTMGYWTEKMLEDELKMPVLARYSIDQAVKDGFVADYQITVKTAPLDNTVKTKNSKGKLLTEKERFDRISHVIEEKEGTGEDLKFLRLNRMRIIQNSIGKIEATKKLLTKFKDERVLVFSGTKEVAESFGCPFHHSGIKDEEVYDNFKAGKGENHLSVIRIGAAGVTYKPLSKVVINYFDSSEENLIQKINRCMGLEFDNPDKKADIWVVYTGEEVEKKWLDKALSALDPRKIKYE